jgi:hypothetical protein
VVFGVILWGFFFFFWFDCVQSKGMNLENLGAFG